MSPVPLKVVETERVQGPLMLSETCPSPAAQNWPTHPTRRSPAKTDSDRRRVYDERRVPVEAAAPWMNSGDSAAVEIVRGADGAECSFAPSKGSAAYV